MEIAMKPATRYIEQRRRGLATAAALLLTTGPAAAAPMATVTIDLQVVVEAFQIVPGYDDMQLTATMEGEVIRSDGSAGHYAVSRTLLYPMDPRASNGAGVVDVLNAVMYESNPAVGTDPGDVSFPSVFPFASVMIGSDFLFCACRVG
jgi:hypothetical protein